jgi:hypothetical protein
MLALAGAAAAALAELGRLAVLRARLDRDGVRAWFLAEAGLADTIAALEPGRDFSDRLTAPTVPPAEPAAPWTYVSSFADDADDDPDDPVHDSNEQVLLRVTAGGPPPVRRRLQAVVGRSPDPFFPGALTLAGGVRELTGDFRLDGRDSLMDTGCVMEGSGNARAGLALPEGAALPALDHPEWITGRGGTPSVARVAGPDLSGLENAPQAPRQPAGPLASELGSTAEPRFTLVEGDAVVDGTTTGAGVLYATGRLRISGALAFTGVVAAAGGVELLTTGELAVCGALWAGGDPALTARGRGGVRASADGIRWAARFAALPARARVIAVRELF